MSHKAAFRDAAARLAAARTARVDGGEGPIARASVTISPEMRALYRARRDGAEPEAVPTPPIEASASMEAPVQEPDASATPREAVMTMDPAPDPAPDAASEAAPAVATEPFQTLTLSRHGRRPLTIRGVLALSVQSTTELDAPDAGGGVLELRVALILEEAGGLVAVVSGTWRPTDGAGARVWRDAAPVADAVSLAAFLARFQPGALIPPPRQMWEAVDIDPLRVALASYGRAVRDAETAFDELCARLRLSAATS